MYRCFMCVVLLPLNISLSTSFKGLLITVRRIWLFNFFSWMMNIFKLHHRYGMQKDSETYAKFLRIFLSQDPTPETLVRKTEFAYAYDILQLMDVCLDFIAPIRKQSMCGICYSEFGWRHGRLLLEGAAWERLAKDHPLLMLEDRTEEELHLEL